MDIVFVTLIVLLALLTAALRRVCERVRGENS
jgi:hypothetical protein